MEIKLAPLAHLFRVIQYSDPNAGNLFIHVPVTPAGHDDPMRPHEYVGETMIGVNGQAIPLRFPIPAANLEEAIAQYSAAGEAEVLRMHNEMLRQRLLNRS